MRQASILSIVPTSAAELATIETYYDTVPRAASAAAVEIGPFVLFVAQGHFPYYARPRAGVKHCTPDDVTAVRRRQRELGVPEAFEWIDDLQPTLVDAVRAAGLVVYQLPLMVNRGAVAVRPPPGVRVRIMAADDPEVPQVQAAVGVGFSAPGTRVGPVGDIERVAAEQDLASVHQALRDRIAAGRQVLAGAFGADGAVAGGSHIPVGTTSEITGLATLPAYRRRGIGASVTSALITDAMGGGVACCFLSAGSDEIARVYARAGFERIATACIAGASN